MMIDNSDNAGVKQKKPYSLEPSKYYCPKTHGDSSFAGEVKDSSGARNFVTSKEFRDALDNIFRD